MTGWENELLPHWLDPDDSAEQLLLSKLREYVERSTMATAEFELACVDDSNENRRDLAAYCLARLMQEQSPSDTKWHAVAGGRELLSRSLSPTVTRELVVGLGRSGDPAGLVVTGFADDPSSEVREAVAMVAPNLHLDGVQEAEACVAVLVKLAQDDAPSVREWAVFGLVLLLDAGVIDDRASSAVTSAKGDPEPAVRAEADKWAASSS